MIKIRNVLLVIVGLLLISSLTLFFFYDLEISKLLVNENPHFLFVLLAAIGEFPIYIGPILFGLVYGFTNKEKWSKLFSHFVGLLATYIACTRLCNGILEEFYHSQFGLVQELLLTVASLITYVLLTMVVAHVDKSRLEKLRGVSLLGLLVSITSFSLVSGMKVLWGRMRFRSLSEGYSEYTNFLTINGISKLSLTDDYQSFPSGHTNSASCVLILIPLFKILNNKKWINLLVIGTTSIYTLVVGISRICVGAHYASDVLIGFSVFVISYLLVKYVLKKKGWLDVRSDKC